MKTANRPPEKLPEDVTSSSNSINLSNKNCSLSTYCVQFPLHIYTAGTPTFSISSLKLKTTTGKNIQDHLHIVFFFYLTLISLNSTTNLNNAGFSFSIFNKGLVSIRSKNCFHCLETYEKQVKNCLESTE